MTLRMVDFDCRECGHELEVLVEPGEGATCPNCDVRMTARPGAPAIKYVKPHFHRGLGRYIKDAQHRDRLLKETGFEIMASQNDRARLLELPSVEEQGAKERQERQKKRINEIAQKTESELNLGGYLERGELPGRLEDKVRKATAKAKSAGLA